MNDLIKRLENLKSEIQNLKFHLSLPQKEQKVLELEEKMQASDFWNDNENAQKVSRDYNQLKKFVDFWAGPGSACTSEVLDLVKAECRDRISGNKLII